MLTALDLSVEVGGRFTLQDATFTIAKGDKVGLVGRNGTGKTSMFKVLAGESSPAAGNVKITGALGYLVQQPLQADVDHTALSHVLQGRGIDEARVRMEKLRVAMEEDPSERNINRYTRAHDNYEAHGGYEADSEVMTILNGLGLKADRAELPFRVLSGGERRRVDLARILFGGSDVLLLDEPTNHLDVDAKQWLMEFLRGYKGALLVISHDLVLLDESINRVLHLDEGHIIEYKGTYTQYTKARAEDEIRLARLAERQQTEINRLQTTADRMHAKASKARMAQSIYKRVARLEAAKVDAPTKKRHLSVRLPEPPHCGRTVLEVEDLAKAYEGPPVFEDITFAVERGERLLILGLNGAGKTSMLRILAGVSEADLGEFRWGLDVNPGYFAQEHENIVAGRTVLSHIQREFPCNSEPEQRGLLGMFGLHGDIAFQDASTLSGGEKTKLSMAMLVGGRHNVLLLDEPTNNLDPPSRDAIGSALAEWKGAMLVVSHDVEFVEALQPQRVLIMPDGTLDYFSEDLLDLVELA